MPSMNRANNRTWLWFLLCCILPLAVLLIMAGMGWNVGNLLFLALLLVCPISMFWMMRRGDGSREPGTRAAGGGSSPTEPRKSDEDQPEELHHR